MSSRGVLVWDVMRPGGCFVVVCSGLQTAVQDADKPVGELAQGGVVVEFSSSLLVVLGAGAGRSLQCGLSLRHERINEPVVVHEPGQHDLLLS